MSAPPYRGVLTPGIYIMDHTTWICWSDASLFCCVQNHWVCTETVVRSFCVNALAINTAVWVLTFIRVFKMEGNVSRKASTKQLYRVNQCLYFLTLEADFPVCLLLSTEILPVPIKKNRQMSRMLICNPQMPGSIWIRRFAEVGVPGIPRIQHSCSWFTSSYPHGIVLAGIRGGHALWDYSWAHQKEGLSYLATMFLSLGWRRKAEI